MRRRRGHAGEEGARPSGTLGRFGVDDGGAQAVGQARAKASSSTAHWVAVGSHVQHSNGLRGVVTKLGYQGQDRGDDEDRIRRCLLSHGTDENNAYGRGGGACDRFRLQTPNEWLQAQIDGAVCAYTRVDRSGTAFATKDGRTQRMVYRRVERRRAVCALQLDRTEGASRALQNDLSAWGIWSHPIVSLRPVCEHIEASETQQHVERVLAMAAEPSTPPTATTNADDDRETPEPRRLTAPAAPAVPPRRP